MARTSKKLTNALLELIMMCNDTGVCVKFDSPCDPENKQELYGIFDAGMRQIIIYKDRTASITPSTIFSLAHEFRHARQYLEMYQPSYWIYAIAATGKVRQDVKDEIERDADAYAETFLLERKIPVPKRMVEG